MFFAEAYSNFSFKNRIREFRHMAGISQKMLADDVGVSINTISSFENGLFSPTARHAFLICKSLGCKFEDLFYFD